MIKLIDILNEIKINNPLITFELVKKFILKNSNIFANNIDEFQNIVYKYNYKYNNGEYNNWLEVLYKLDKNKLEEFYKELEKLKNGNI